MNKVIPLSVMLFMFAVPGFAQKKPLPKKPVQKHPAPLRVSSYMRNVGLLYIEALEDAEKICIGTDISPSGSDEDCDSGIDQWQTLDKIIADRIDLQLSESHASDDGADMKFWELLQHTSSFEYGYLMDRDRLHMIDHSQYMLDQLLTLTGKEEYSQRKAENDRDAVNLRQEIETLSPLRSACKIVARRIIKDGIYEDPLNCVDNWKKYIDAQAILMRKFQK
jgi:hypothetical protein